MMPRRTVLLILLLIAIAAALVWFQLHEQYLNRDVQRGGMSETLKQSYLKKGIDCQEIYSVQGSETMESVNRLYGLSQHELYNLNPGVGMQLQAGSSVCVRGIWGVKAVSGHSIPWFWPAVAGAACIAGFLGSKLVPAKPTAHGLPH